MPRRTRLARGLIEGGSYAVFVQAIASAGTGWWQRVHSGAGVAALALPASRAFRRIGYASRDLPTVTNVAIALAIALGITSASAQTCQSERVVLYEENFAKIAFQA
jgi:hypothetical protein